MSATQCYHRACQIYEEAVASGAKSRYRWLLNSLHQNAVDAYTALPLEARKHVDYPMRLHL